MTDPTPPAEQTSADEAQAAPVDNTPVDNTLSVEDLLESLEHVTAERDELTEKLSQAQEQAKEREAELVDQAQRVGAELANFRKASDARSSERASEGVRRLAEQLLAVLDACDAAVHHGDTSVEPIAKLLLGKLTDAGLSRIAAAGEPFDPAEHEALRHEGAPSAADDSAELWVVSEERAGYRFGDRVLRAAQVVVGSRAPASQAASSATSSTASPATSPADGPDASAEGT